MRDVPSRSFPASSPLPNDEGLCAGRACRRIGEKEKNGAKIVPREDPYLDVLVFGASSRRSSTSIRQYARLCLFGSSFGRSPPANRLLHFFPPSIFPYLAHVRARGAESAAATIRRPSGLSFFFFYRYTRHANYDRPATARRSVASRLEDDGVTMKLTTTTTTSTMAATTQRP